MDLTNLSPKFPSKLSVVSDSQQLSYPRNVGPRTELRYKDKSKAKSIKPVKLPQFKEVANCYGSFHDLQELIAEQDSTDESTPLASLSKKRQNAYYSGRMTELQHQFGELQENREKLQAKFPFLKSTDDESLKEEPLFAGRSNRPSLNPMNAAWKASVECSPRQNKSPRVHSNQVKPVRTHLENSKVKRGKIDPSKFEVVLDIESSLLNSNPPKGQPHRRPDQDSLDGSFRTEQEGNMTPSPFVAYRVKKLLPSSIRANSVDKSPKEQPRIEFPMIKTRENSPQTRNTEHSPLKKSNWKSIKIEKIVTIDEEFLRPLEHVLPKVSPKSPQMHRWKTRLSPPRINHKQAL